MSTDELEYLRASIDEIKQALQKLIDKEESRASRLNEVEREIAIIKIQADQHQRDNERQFDEAFTKIRVMQNAPLNTIKTAGAVAGAVLTVIALIGIIVGAIVLLHDKGLIK